MSQYEQPLKVIEAEKKFKTLGRNGTNKWDVNASVEVLNQPTLSLGSYELTKKYTLADILNTEIIITNSLDTFFNKL